MISENIAIAKARLSRLVNTALDGEEVLLCKDGVPAVRLVSVHPSSQGGGPLQGDCAADD